MLYPSQKPTDFVDTESNARPMYICATGDAKQDQILLRQKLIDYSNYLQISTIKNHIQKGIALTFDMKSSEFKNFITDLNIELLQKKNKDLKKDFEGITNQKREKVEKKGHELYDTNNKTYPNYFVQEISIGTCDSINSENHQVFLDNFQTPGGHYTISGEEFIFGFQTIEVDDADIEHQFRYGVILLSNKMVRTLRAVEPDKADSVLRYMSKIRQYMNHDRYHNFMMFEDEKLNKSKIIKGYTSGYELHSAKTHADLFKETIKKNQKLHQELVDDMKHYVELIMGLNDMANFRKKYFLLTYFYAFRRLFDNSDPEFSEMIDRLKKVYNIDITDITGGADEAPETTFVDYIHNGGSILTNGGKYLDYGEIMKL